MMAARMTCLPLKWVLHYHPVYMHSCVLAVCAQSTYFAAPGARPSGTGNGGIRAMLPTNDGLLTWIETWL
jgi:hypothetical protein